MSDIGRFEKLWRTLEYGSTAQVEKILTNRDVQTAIQSGLKIYKKAGGSPSIKRIEDEKELSAVDKLTIIRLSALLNLDEDQSKYLVQSYESKMPNPNGVIDTDGWVIDMDYSEPEGSQTRDFETT